MSLLAATLYQGNHDRNHNLWNIISTERYILHMQVLLECGQELRTPLGHLMSPTAFSEVSIT
jgi:hypothetical protein